MRGGTAGQIMIVSKYASNDPRTEALGATLANLGRTFARNNDVQIAVGGPEGSLGDMTSVAQSRIWLDVAVIAIAIALVLGLALRAVLLPAVATIFSLLLTAATFGVLQLLFGGSSPLLGGPGYLDPATLIGIFTIAFSISIVNTAVLLMDTKERLATGGSYKSAVSTSLRRTAAGSTGAALVSAAVLIPFATSDLINVRTFGIGIVIALLLDVLILRPVLLPAAEAVLGRVGWWPTAPEPNRAGGAQRNRRPRRFTPPHLRHRSPDPAAL